MFKLATDCYIPENKYNMEMQVWDKDVFSPNDYLCSYKFTAFEIFNVIRNCITNERSSKFILKGDSRKDGKFEVVAKKNPNKPDSTDCKLLLSIECLTEAEYSSI